MTNTIESRIETLVTPITNKANLFIESVSVTRGKQPLVRITIDLKEGTGAVDSELVTIVSRDISALLDEADPIQGAYTLEVSTPGAERKLSTPRHFARSVGLLVEIKTVDAKRVKGRITRADEESVTVSVAGKKGQPDSEVVVELDKISKAHSRIDFGSLGK